MEDHEAEEGWATVAKGRGRGRVPPNKGEVETRPDSRGSGSSSDMSGHNWGNERRDRGGGGQRGGGSQHGGSRGGQFDDARRGAGGGSRGQFNDARRGAGGGRRGQFTDSRGSRGHFNDSRGGGGDQFRSSSSRGRQTLSKISTVDKVDIKSIHKKELAQKQAGGWLEIPEDLKEIELPKSKGVGVQFEEMKTIVVNSYPAKIQLPDVIYHYEAKIARLEKNNYKDEDVRKIKLELQEMGEVKKIPNDLRQQIIGKTLTIIKKSLNEKERNEIGIITDYASTIYSQVRLDEKLKDTYKISIEELPEYTEDMGRGFFIVVVSPTQGHYSTKSIKDHINKLIGVKEESVMIRLEQTYNTLLKNVGGKNYKPVGRSTLIKQGSSSNAGQDIGGGLGAWPGISLIFTFGWRPYVSLDIQHMAYIKSESCLKVLEEVVGRDIAKDVSRWREDDLNKARSFLKTCKITYKIPNREKLNGGTINDVIRTCPKDYRFKLTDGKETNVENFFRENGVRLQYPRGPCLKLQKNAVVPAELCQIKSGQSYNRKLDAEQTSKIMDFSRKKPKDLLDTIISEYELLGLTFNPLLKLFGASVSEKLLKMKVRKLKAPNLRYGSMDSSKEASICPYSGEWDFWKEPLKFFRPGKCEKWFIISLCVEKSHSNDSFIKIFTSKSKEKGLYFSPPARIDYGKDSDYGINEIYSAEENTKKLERYFNIAKKEKADMVLVIIPKKNSPLYAQSKQVSELTVGIVTQCVAWCNYEKANGSTIQNIILKVNMKMGGINHCIDFPNIGLPEMSKIFFVPTLMLGADVTHPSPGEGQNPGFNPSFAAVTAAIDPFFMKHKCSIKAQVKAEKGAAEVIIDLQRIVKEMIDSYTKENGYRPLRIIYYRDGVGDGQFKEVLDVEMRAIREACKEYGPQYQPPITFVIVQKRHKMRGFMHDTKGGYCNCEPGTVIDEEIVNRWYSEFYLFAHKGMLGTSRATHYVILWDDSEFSTDQLQMLSYYLCYAHARCLKSVRVPGITLSAHLAAARARIYYEQNPDPEITANRPTNSSSESEKLKFIDLLNQKIIRVHNNLKELFYYL